jgi:transketolase
MNNASAESINEIKIFAFNLRKKILDMSLIAGADSSHFGGALSIVEIVSVLFSDIMRINENNPLWEGRDRFILSKGHACLAYYAALSEIGYISDDELKTFEKNESNLLGHPVINRNLGIEFSNGSLGMGLSLGIGVCLGLKKKNMKNQVYVVLGDGECNEGSVWEGAMSASNFNLENLTVVVDHNKFQQTGSNDEIMKLDNLKEKWISFGWETIEIDGHDIEKLKYFLAKDKEKKPRAIIANTIKGKGFSFSENNNSWHHAVMTKKFYDQAKEELEKNFKL